MDNPDLDNHQAVIANPFDAYPPAETARLVQRGGVKKANMPLVPTMALGVLAGAFIAFGGALFTLVMTGNNLGLGPGRWLGGIAFSLGLDLVVIRLCASKKPNGPRPAVTTASILIKIMVGEVHWT
ncbi:MAG: formate/nitrite transporter family protein [Geminicoccaceae bacterium]